MAYIIMEIAIETQILHNTGTNFEIDISND